MKREKSIKPAKIQYILTIDNFFSVHKRIVVPSGHISVPDERQSNVFCRVHIQTGMT